MCLPLFLLGVTIQYSRVNPVDGNAMPSHKLLVWWLTFKPLRTQHITATLLLWQKMCSVFPFHRKKRKMQSRSPSTVQCIHCILYPISLTCRPDTDSTVSHTRHSLTHSPYPHRHLLRSQVEKFKKILRNEFKNL